MFRSKSVCIEASKSGGFTLVNAAVGLVVLTSLVQFSTNLKAKARQGRVATERSKALADSHMKVVGHCRIGDSIEAVRERCAGAVSIQQWKRAFAGIPDLAQVMSVRWKDEDHFFNGRFRNDRLEYATEAVIFREKGNGIVTGRIATIGPGNPWVLNALNVINGDFYLDDGEVAQVDDPFDQTPNADELTSLKSSPSNVGDPLEQR